MATVLTALHSLLLQLVFFQASHGRFGSLRGEEDSIGFHLLVSHIRLYIYIYQKEMKECCCGDHVVGGFKYALSCSPHLDIVALLAHFRPTVSSSS